MKELNNQDKLGFKAIFSLNFFEIIVDLHAIVRNSIPDTLYLVSSNGIIQWYHQIPYDNWAIDVDTVNIQNISTCTRIPHVAPTSLFPPKRSPKPHLPIWRIRRKMWQDPCPETPCISDVISTSGNVIYRYFTRKAIGKPFC